MSTLLLRLAAPLQSWGTDSRYEDQRRTDLIPSKSGVIGMIAAALGRERNADISDLSSLRFGVRIDKRGEILSDFHTAHNAKHAFVTHRQYLSDAAFLAGVESDDKTFLQSLDYALCHPVFSLYLGRRSCPPTPPVSLGLRELSLEEALKQEPWIMEGHYMRKAYNSHEDDKVHIFIDGESGVNTSDSKLVEDVPISYDPRNRRYGWRSVKDCGYHKIIRTDGQAAEYETDHDPFSELED